MASLVWPQQNQATLSDLPPEILYQILKPLLPILDRNPWPTRISYLHDQSMASSSTYGLRLKFFADFRLICRVMDHFVSSLLFEELLLVFRQSTRLEPIVNIFEHSGHLIRSLSVNVPYPLGTFREAVSQVIRRGLGKCPNLRRLECLGYHPPFSSLGWPSNHMCEGQFPHGITSLCFSPNNRDHFEQIAGIGSSLKSLRISGGSVPQNALCHEPSPFPKLEELTLEKLSSLSCHHVFEFLRHTSLCDTSYQGCRTTLQTLNVIHSKMTLEDMHHILRVTNLGKDITTFRWIWCYRVCGTGCDIHPSVRTLFTVLPNLKDFYLGCPGFPVHFGWLPRSLEHLTIFVPVVHASIIPWIISYIDWLQCRGCRPLRSITLLSTPLVPESITPELKERCREVGARAQLVHDPWMNTDGIKVLFPQT